MSLVANLSLTLNGNNIKSIVKIQAFSNIWNDLIMMRTAKMVMTAGISCTLCEALHQHYLHRNTSRKQVLPYYCPFTKDKREGVLPKVKLSGNVQFGP